MPQAKTEPTLSYEAHQILDGLRSSHWHWSAADLMGKYWDSYPTKTILMEKINSCIVELVESGWVMPRIRPHEDTGEPETYFMPTR